MIASKPTYPEAFDLIAGLPPEICPSVVAALLWIWRHTNSDPTNENYGKAWKSQANLAVEMHVSDKTVQRVFDDAEAQGVISREHLFKKNGKIVVSTAPYRKATSKGTGEYLHSRYWINWTTVRKMQIGIVRESTPSANGVVTESTPTQIGVVTESTPVVTESTKVLIEGSIFTNSSDPEEEYDDAYSRIGGARTRDHWGASQGAAAVVGDPPSEKSKAAGNEKRNPFAEKAAPESSISIFSAGESEETPEFRDPIVDAERRQVDRHLTNSQICEEFKFIFDRLCQQGAARDRYRGLRFIGEVGHRVPNPAFDEAALDAMPPGISLTWKRPLPKHQKAAAEYFRAVGRDVALAKWEEFLVDGEHEVSQPLGNDETGKPLGFETVQQDWLLYIFVKEEMATVEDVT
jgi:hypothetical protein